MPTNRDDELDMATLLAVLDEARKLVETLDGEQVNIEGLNNKEAMTRKSHVNKQLLYAAHLADTARLEAMNQYHRFKGEEPPVITT